MALPARAVHKRLQSAMEPPSWANFLPEALRHKPAAAACADLEGHSHIETGASDVAKLQSGHQLLPAIPVGEMPLGGEATRNSNFAGNHADWMVLNAAGGNAHTAPSLVQSNLWEPLGSAAQARLSHTGQPGGSNSGVGMSTAPGGWDAPSYGPQVPIAWTAQGPMPLQSVQPPQQQQLPQEQAQQQQRQALQQPQQQQPQPQLQPPQQQQQQQPQQQQHQMQLAEPLMQPELRQPQQQQNQQHLRHSQQYLQPSMHQLQQQVQQELQTQQHLQQQLQLLQPQPQLQPQPKQHTDQKQDKQQELSQKRRQQQQQPLQHRGQQPWQQQQQLLLNTVQLQQLQQLALPPPQRQQQPQHAGQTSNLGLQGKIIDVWPRAKDVNGCRLVQKAFEDGSNEERAALAEQLHEHVWEGLRDPHANYVIQKCITHSMPQDSAFIVRELLSGPGGASAARHRYGCRIVERLLEHSQPSMVEPLVAQIMEDAVALCSHPYANYVMQHILEHGEARHKHDLARKIKPNVKAMAADCYACAVIGKALSHCKSEDQKLIARALVQEPGILREMARARFGHVAAKLVFQVLDGPDREEACRQLEPDAQTLRNSRYGRFVAPCLDYNRQAHARTWSHFAGGA